MSEPRLRTIAEQVATLDETLEAIRRIPKLEGDLSRCQERLTRVNADRNQWRERAIAAEQALGLYGPKVEGE